MAEQSRAHQFAAALQEFEQTGEPAPLAALFTADAEVMRPEAEHAPGGPGGVGDFWASYLSPFAEIRSEFSRVDEADDLAVLEWESKGRLSTGREITYRGASLLTYDADDLVVRFATYFDTAAFMHPEESR